MGVFFVYGGLYSTPASAGETYTPASGWIDIGAKNEGLHGGACASNETLYQFDLLEYNSDDTPISVPVTVALASRLKSDNTPVTTVTGNGLTSPELCFNVETQILGISVNGGSSYYDFQSSIRWTPGDNIAIAKGRKIRGHLYLKPKTMPNPDIELVGPVTGWSTSDKPEFQVKVNDIPALNGVTGVYELKVVVQNTATNEWKEKTIRITGTTGTYSLDTIQLPNGSYRWGAYIGLDKTGAISVPPNPKSGWAGWGTFRIDSSAPEVNVSMRPLVPNTTQQVNVTVSFSDYESYIQSAELFVDGVSKKVETWAESQKKNRIDWLTDYAINSAGEFAPFSVDNREHDIKVRVTNYAGLVAIVEPYGSPFRVTDTINFPDFSIWGVPEFNDASGNYRFNNVPKFDCDNNRDTQYCTKSEAGAPLYIAAGFKNIGNANASGIIRVRSKINVGDDTDTTNDVTIFGDAMKITAPTVPETNWPANGGGGHRYVGVWNNPPEGNHRLVEVCFDVDNIVAESDETNNCYPPNEIFVVKPAIDPSLKYDLKIPSSSYTVAHVDPSDTTDYVGDTITATFTIKNDSNGANGVTYTADSATTNLWFEITQFSATGTRLWRVTEGPFTVPALMSGEQRLFTHSIDVNTSHPGQVRYSITAIIDPREYEVPLVNNYRILTTGDFYQKTTTSTTIGDDSVDPEKRPDLKVPDATIPAKVISGAMATFPFTIKNDDVRDGFPCNPGCASSMDVTQEVSVELRDSSGRVLAAATTPTGGIPAGGVYSGVLTWVGEVKVDASGNEASYDDLQICVDFPLAENDPGVVEELNDSKESNCKVIDPFTVLFQCRDGEDNDGDGQVDHPGSPFLAPPTSLVQDSNCDQSVTDDEEGTHFLSVAAQKRLVERGQTVVLNISAQSVGTCTIKGSDGSSYSRTTPGGASPGSGLPTDFANELVETQPLSKITTYVLTCKAVNGADLPNDIASTFVLVSLGIKER